MAVQAAEEDFRRRARRRLMGAVALTILAVIILPLVLDKEPPPAGPLNIQMPTTPETMPADAESVSTPPVEPPAAEPEADRTRPIVDSRTASQTKPSTGDRNTGRSPAAPSAPRAGEGDFSVQVGAFSDAANVNRIKAKIQSLGLPAYTNKLGSTTRVRAGPFKDKAAAQKAADKLAAAGLPGKLEGP